MTKLADWRIQELRTAALRDLNEFIPKNFYATVHTSGEAEFKDRELVRLLNSMQFTDPKLTPRQLASVRLLEAVGMCSYAERVISETAADDWREGVTPESFRNNWLLKLNEELNRYLLHLSEDEARGLRQNREGPQTTPTSPPIERRKKAALIREVVGRWPSIDSDLRHAAENGLRSAAKLPQHGDWNLAAALQWAKESGKLTVKQELDPMELINRRSLHRQ